MLDTNIVSALSRNPQGDVSRQIKQVGPDAICVSIITAAELHFGCVKKGSAKLQAQIEAILDSVQVFALDMPADGQYGRIRAELEGAGTPIGPNDMLIAAHALAQEAILVTANTGEFSRVRGLQIENWLN